MFFRTLQLWMFLMNYCQYQQPMLTPKYPFAFSFVGGNAQSKTSICIHCTLNSVNSGQLVSSQIQTTQCYPKFSYNRRCYPEFRLFTDSVIKYSYFPCDLNIVTIYSIFMFYFSQVNQKMMLTLTASIMYWYLKRPTSHPLDSENGSSCETTSITISDDSASESSIDDNTTR